MVAPGCLSFAVSNTLKVESPGPRPRIYLWSVKGMKGEWSDPGLEAATRVQSSEGPGAPLTRLQALLPSGSKASPVPLPR